MPEPDRKYMPLQRSGTQKAPCGAMMLRSGWKGALPGAYGNHADRVAGHVRLKAKASAEIEFRRFARGDVGGTRRPPLLGLEHLAIDVLGFDADLSRCRFRAIVHQLAAEAQPDRGARAGGGWLAEIGRASWRERVGQEG